MKNIWKVAMDMIASTKEAATIADLLSEWFIYMSPHFMSILSRPIFPNNQKSLNS